MAASRKVTSQAVSHLPIPPPEWCRLPKDKDLPRIFFHAGKDLPTTFLFDDSSRCSCGVNESFEEVTTTSLIIYTSVFAIEKQIETRYCPICRNTRGRIGPDLGKYGILNWNNKIAFSHELMNAFTSCFTTSETPAYSFHQQIINAYLNDNSRPFCSIQTFLSAWFAFARLQIIDSNMECFQCGPNPPIIIADGISVAFAKRRVEGLKPPTASDPSVSHIKLAKGTTKTTCFTGTVTLRTAIQKAIDADSLSDDERSKILAIVDDKKVISQNQR